MTTTSTQYITAIDNHYPVAGRDNDSQGFRDNFSNIKLAFDVINSDIDSLSLTVSGITDNPTIDQFLTASTVGFPSMENMFVNPFLDIWSNGPTADPDSTITTGATVAKTTSTSYAQANGVSAAVTVITTSTSSGIALRLQEPLATWDESRDFSFMVAVRVPAGQPSVRVYAGNEGAAVNKLIGQVNSKDTWVAVRGTVGITSETKPEIRINCWNGTTFTTGTFYVGGCTVVNGTWSPKYLTDSGRRSEYLVPSITYPPAFVGQRALVDDNLYMAIGTTTATQWSSIDGLIIQ